MSNLLKYISQTKDAIRSSRHDTGLVHDPKLMWASGESETKGKAGKVCGSNLMI